LGIELTGLDAGEFVFTESPVIIPLGPHESRVVWIAFDPTARGAKSAQVRITTDDDDEPAVDVDLTGMGATDREASGIERWDAYD
jgi:hypothetical protein